MKTKILNWDVNIQWLLIAINVLCLGWVLYVPYFIFWWMFFQLLWGAYQFTSSTIHLILNHKSIGFRSCRWAHFWACIFIIALLEHFNKVGGFNNEPVNFIAFILIPQVMLHVYFMLCRKELHYLQSRGFFILR